MMREYSGESHESRVKKTARRSTYDVISYENRKWLIKLVMEDGVSIYRASKITGINNATSKVIIRKYRDEGTIFLRKSEREKIKTEELENTQLQESPRPQRQDREDALLPSRQQEEPMVVQQNSFYCPYQLYFYPTICYYSPSFL